MSVRSSICGAFGEDAGSVDELSSTTAALKLAITNTTFRDAEWAGRRALLRGLHEVIEGPVAAIHARWPIAQIEVESRR
jgi:hypothetical protein